MVLTRSEILSRLREREVIDDQSLVITPLLCTDEDELFDADSVDLRLGTFFLLPRSLDQPYFSPDRTSATSLHDRVHVPLGKYLVVPAHQTILGATLEFIKLPADVSGEILTKSSVARTFIVVETAPWIHPEYRGCLTLEIANVSNTPVLLYPGRLIGQLILMKIAPPEPGTGPGTGEVTSVGQPPNKTYFGPVYPEAPKFKDPQDDLAEIGVLTVSTVKRKYLRRGRGGWREYQTPPR